MAGVSRRTTPIHIIGRKNSGKTTLICELVGQLCARGYRVGTIKHTSHRHELDTPGKDSQRHRTEGAIVSGIISPGLCATFWPTPINSEAEDKYSKILRMYDDCDLVLVEGDTQTSAPKIEVWRSTTDGVPFATAGLDVLAVVTDEPLACPVPVWSRSDVPGLIHRILEIAGFDKSADSMREAASVPPQDLAVSSSSPIASCSGR